MWWPRPLAFASLASVSLHHLLDSALAALRSISDIWVLGAGLIKHNDHAIECMSQCAPTTHAAAANLQQVFGVLCCSKHYFILTGWYSNDKASQLAGFLLTGWYGNDKASQLAGFD